MASLQKDPSGNWHVHFRFGGKRFKRSLQTKKEAEAKALCGRIEDNIQLVRRGAKALPPSADVFLFLLSDGKIKGPVDLPDRLTIEQLFSEYEQAVANRLEKATIYTIGVHTRHFKRLLDRNFDPRVITLRHLDDYVSTRQMENTRRGGKVSATTVRKEIATLSAIWGWAEERYDLGPLPNTKKLSYAKVAERPPFQTWEEIEAQVAREGLTEVQQAELWNCLFLSLGQISELLAYVKENGTQPFLYPMVVMAAHTGARRSELIRSRIVDFQGDSVIVRERKRVRGKHSIRRIPTSTTLRRVMSEWFEICPGGQSTFHLGRICRSKNHREHPEPITKDQAHDHFKRTLAGSKWEVLRGWHVLRHSFISNCAAKGLDQRIIDSFVGHTTEEMRRRYTHLFPSAKKDAIRSVFG